MAMSHTGARPALRKHRKIVKREMLSAKGSISLPKSEICAYFLAIFPSRKSDVSMTAARTIQTKTDQGLSITKKKMKNGEIKILVNVIIFGVFIYLGIVGETAFGG